MIIRNIRQEQFLLLPIAEVEKLEKHYYTTIFNYGFYCVKREVVLSGKISAISYTNFLLSDNAIRERGGLNVNVLTNVRRRNLGVEEILMVAEITNKYFDRLRLTADIYSKVSNRNIIRFRNSHNRIDRNQVRMSVESIKVEKDSDLRLDRLWMPENYQKTLKWWSGMWTRIDRE